jgi:hypothetical protein
MASIPGPAPRPLQASGETQSGLNAPIDAPQQPADGAGSLSRLPGFLLETILALAGPGGFGAYAACSTLHRAWLSAMRSPAGVASYLRGRLGRQQLQTYVLRLYNMRGPLKNLCEGHPRSEHGALALATIQALQHSMSNADEEQNVGVALQALLETFAKAGHTEVLRYALACGARLTPTTLERAAQAGHADSLRFMLEEARRSVDREPAGTIDGPRPPSCSPAALAAAAMGAAAYSGDTETVRLLLESGGRPSAADALVPPAFM